MDQCTHDMRAAYWKNIIQNCHQRPAGKSIRRWLEENDILEQSYYYWQRKLRNEAYDVLQETGLTAVQNNSNEVSFAEMTMPVNQVSQTDYFTDMKSPTAVIRTDSVSIMISNNISNQILHEILQEVLHA